MTDSDQSDSHGVPNENASESHETISVAQAATLVGKSRQTLYRMAKGGQLSVTRQSDGSKGFHTSELLRVFGDTMRQPIVMQEAGVGEGTPKKSGQPVTPSETAELQTELAVLRERLQGKEALIEHLESQVDAQTLLITDQRSKGGETSASMVLASALVAVAVIAAAAYLIPQLIG